jgi:hypothetical protein
MGLSINQYLGIALYDFKAPLKLELGVGDLSERVIRHFQDDAITKGLEHPTRIADIYSDTCCQELQHI